MNFNKHEKKKIKSKYKIQIAEQNIKNKKTYMNEKRKQGIGNMHTKK